MRIFISAGEPSGDLHAANLIHSLRLRMPEAQFVGYGGPRMAGEGVTLLYPLVNLAIMWFVHVFLNIATFIRLIIQADRYFRDERPDALILVDYPGLHWWIAKRARARGVPVFYYVTPQLWAWAGWRVEKVKRTVDLALCSLPFEPEWYRARGYDKAIYVGHPYFDELNERELDEEFVAQQEQHRDPLVAILPGSRKLELIRNLPIMVRAAVKLSRQRPHTRFGVACLHERHEALARTIIARTLEEFAGQPVPPPAPALEIFAGKTPELIRVARAAWSVSGSVSLELMMEALPTVILYKVKRIDLWIARPFIKARYITLVNLLADAELMPEYLTHRDVSDDMNRWALSWLNDPQAHARATANLAALRHQVAQPGASERAADRIVQWLLAHPAMGATTGSVSSKPLYRGLHDSPHRVETVNEEPGARKV